MKDAEISPHLHSCLQLLKVKGKKLIDFLAFMSNSIENLHIEIEQIFSRGRDLKCAVLLNYSV